MELTNRELATILVFAAFIVLCVVASPDRSSLRAASIDVLKAVLAWKLLSVFLAYSAYVFVLIATANWLGVWSGSLLKNTVISTLFVGLPIVGGALELLAGHSIILSVVRRVFGFSVLAGAYVNLVDLPLWVEVILIAVTFPLLLIAMVAGRRHDEARAARLCRTVLGLIGVGLAAHVTARLISDFGAFDWGAVIQSFLLSVLLPIALIPFAYLVAILASVEGTLILLKFHNSRVPPPVRVRIALLLGLRGSLFYATAFTGPWLPRAAGEQTFRGALRLMRDYRGTVRANRRQERRRHRLLAANAGETGWDDAGLWIDRREFHETKQGLEEMFFAQMASHRHFGGRYRTDPAVVFPAGGFKGLPEPHGVRFAVRDDGQSWMGWRQTVGGLYLGVGGTSDIDGHWRYAGTEQPDAYPSDESKGWALLALDRDGYLKGAPEWDFDDAPIRRS